MQKGRKKGLCKLTHMRRSRNTAPPFGTTICRWVCGASLNELLIDRLAGGVREQVSAWPTFCASVFRRHGACPKFTNSLKGGWPFDAVLRGLISR